MATTNARYRVNLTHHGARALSTLFTAGLLLIFLLMALGQGPVPQNRSPNRNEEKIIPAGAVTAHAAPSRMANAPAKPSPIPTTADIKDRVGLNPVAEVNGRPIDAAWLRIMVRADSAMNVLVAAKQDATYDLALSAEAREQTLARLVNGELVRQAAEELSYAIAQIAVDQQLEQLLLAHGLTRSDLDQTLFDHQLTAQEFSGYFAQLLLVNRFSQEQAASLDLSVTAYISLLRDGARISFASTADVVLSELVQDLLPIGAQVSTNHAPDPKIIPSPDKPPASDGMGDSTAMPFLNLPLLSEDSVAPLLDYHAGAPTVLSFWTTWCPYCRQQTPVLSEAFAQVGHQAELQFIGINVEETVDKVRQYVASAGIDYPILLDADGAVAEHFDVHGYPTTLFLDAEEKIVARHVGALTDEKLASYIEQLTRPPNIEKAIAEVGIVDR